jgi:starvation-inducible DNA-binding protein
VALPAPSRQALVSVLNAHVATGMDLYTQVKQAQWNVAGPEFIALHQLFDIVASNVARWTDQIAERAGTLGGYVIGTARLTVAGSFLTEYDLDALSGPSHVKALVGQVATYTARLREAISNASTVEDPATVDLLTRVLGESERDLWLLESHLG